MTYAKWIFILSAILLAGCSPKTNDGVVPTQPTYTNTGYPNPLVLYNGILATGITPNVYEYSPTNLTDATGEFLLQDTTTAIPVVGKANLLYGLTGYKDTTWVGFPLLSTGAIDLTSGNFTQVTFYTKVILAAGATSGTISFDALGANRVTMAAPTAWQPVTMSITGAVSGPAATELFVVNFYQNVIAAPVTAYVDQLVFQ